jgi:hypothetical protein
LYFVPTYLETTEAGPRAERGGRSQYAPTANPAERRIKGQAGIFRIASRVVEAAIRSLNQRTTVKLPGFLIIRVPSRIAEPVASGQNVATLSRNQTLIANVWPGKIGITSVESLVAGPHIANSRAPAASSKTRHAMPNKAILER